MILGTKCTLKTNRKQEEKIRREVSQRWSFHVVGLVPNNRYISDWFQSAGVKISSCTLHLLSWLNIASLVNPEKR
jgi:hypothetical protein